MARWRLTLEYQGTRYRGWQAQKNARTIQGEVLAAAAAAFGPVGDFQGAGRTDAGVHALGQTAHLDVEPRVKAAELVRRLNDLLPADINVLQATPAAPRFHARHHAAGRSYLYQVSRRRTAFGKPFVWWVRDGLDLPAMQRAATGLPGMRDFASYADRRAEAAGSTLVLLDEAVVDGAGELILLRFRASHFLWRMVRRLVGTLVEVGRGNLAVEAPARFLETFSEDPAAWTAPPSGLFLEEVVYPGETFQRPLVPVLEITPAGSVGGRGGR